MVKVDGHYYNSITEAPDMGSIVCTDSKGQKRSYYGYYADKGKLPTYDDLEDGSDATLVDTASGSTVVCMYHAKTKTWDEL